jgi:hypothetical protein
MAYTSELKQLIKRVEETRPQRLARGKEGLEFPRMSLAEKENRLRALKTYNSFIKSTSQILEIIREGQEEGIIRKDVNIYIIRQLILSILEHMVTRWLLRGEKYDLLRHYDQVNELVFHGMSWSRSSQRHE